MSGVTDTDRLKALAYPRLAVDALSYLPIPDEYFKELKLKPTSLCCRGPYVSVYAPDASGTVKPESLVGHITLRPNVEISRIPYATVASMRITVPATPPLAFLMVKEVTKMPSTVAQRNVGPVSSSALILPDSVFNMPGDQPSIVAFSDLSKMMEFWAAADGILRILKGDYRLPTPPAPPLTLKIFKRVHNAVVLDLQMPFVPTPGERVHTIGVEMCVGGPGSEVWSSFANVPLAWIPVAPDFVVEAIPLGLPMPVLPSVPAPTEMEIPGYTGGAMRLFAVTGLLPRHEYTLGVVLHNSIGKSPQPVRGREGVVNFTTLGPPSFAPVAPVATNARTTAMDVSWSAVAVSADDAPLQGYILRAISSKKLTASNPFGSGLEVKISDTQQGIDVNGHVVAEMKLEGSTTSATMTNLPTDTLLRFQVAARNAAGMGPWSDASVPIYTLGPLTCPAPEARLADTPRLERELSLPDSCPASIAMLPDLRFLGLPTMLRPKLHELLQALKSRKPAHYTFGRSVGPTYMFLQWGPPELGDHDAPILGYKLHVERCKSESLGTTIDSSADRAALCTLELPICNSVCLSRLLPESRYTLRLQAYNEIGDGPLSPICEIDTTGPPSCKCWSVTGDQAANTHDSVTMHWEIDEGDAAGATGFVAYGKTAEGVWSDPVFVELAKGVRKYSARIHGLQHSTEWTCIVRCFNDCGFGPAVESVQPVFTLRAPSQSPAAPHSEHENPLVYATSNSIKLRIVLPARHILDAPSTGVRVVASMQNAKGDWAVAHTLQYPLAKPAEGDLSPLQTSVTFTDLLPGKCYRFTAIALNVVGPGPVSEMSSPMWTLGPPTTVTDAPAAKLRSFPEHMVCDISWIRPVAHAHTLDQPLHDAPLTGYKIYAFSSESTTKPSEAAMVVNVAGAEHVASVLKDLAPESCFVMRISCVNEVGEGPMSAASNVIQTLCRPQRAPTTSSPQVVPLRNLLFNEPPSAPHLPAAIKSALSHVDAQNALKKWASLTPSDGKVAADLVKLAKISPYLLVLIWQPSFEAGDNAAPLSYVRARVLSEGSPTRVGWDFTISSPGGTPTFNEPIRCVAVDGRTFALAPLVVPESMASQMLSIQLTAGNAIGESTHGVQSAVFSCFKAPTRQPTILHVAMRSNQAIITCEWAVTEDLSDLPEMFEVNFIPKQPTSPAVVTTSIVRILPRYISGSRIELAVPSLPAVELLQLQIRACNVLGAGPWSERSGIIASNMSVSTLRRIARSIEGLPVADPLAPTDFAVSINDSAARGGFELRCSWQNPAILKDERLWNDFQRKAFSALYNENLSYIQAASEVVRGFVITLQPIEWTSPSITGEFPPLPPPCRIIVRGLNVNALSCVLGVAQRATDAQLVAQISNAADTCTLVVPAGIKFKPHIHPFTSDIEINATGAAVTSDSVIVIPGPVSGLSVAAATSAVAMPTHMNAAAPLPSATAHAVHPSIAMQPAPIPAVAPAPHQQAPKPVVSPATVNNPPVTTSQVPATAAPTIPVHPNSQATSAVHANVSNPFGATPSAQAPAPVAAAVTSSVSREKSVAGLNPFGEAVSADKQRTAGISREASTVKGSANPFGGADANPFGPSTQVKPAPPSQSTKDATQTGGTNPFAASASTTVKATTGNPFDNAAQSIKREASSTNPFAMPAATTASANPPVTQKESASSQSHNPFDTAPAKTTAPAPVSTTSVQTPTANADNNAPSTVESPPAATVTPQDSTAAPTSSDTRVLPSQDVSHTNVEPVSISQTAAEQPKPIPSQQTAETTAPAVVTTSTAAATGTTAAATHDTSTPAATIATAAATAHDTNTVTDTKAAATTATVAAAAHDTNTAAAADDVRTAAIEATPATAEHPAAPPKDTTDTGKASSDTASLPHSANNNNSVIIESSIASMSVKELRNAARELCAQQGIAADTYLAPLVEKADLRAGVRKLLLQGGSSGANTSTTSSGGSGNVDDGGKDGGESGGMDVATSAVNHDQASAVNDDIHAVHGVAAVAGNHTSVANENIGVVRDVGAAVKAEDAAIFPTTVNSRSKGDTEHKESSPDRKLIQCSICGAELDASCVYCTVCGCNVAAARALLDVTS